MTTDQLEQTGERESGIHESPKPRMLLAVDDKAIYARLPPILLHAGITIQRERSMKTAYECARFGGFHVVVTAPVLFDGEWNRLAHLASDCRSSFVVILVANEFTAEQRAMALEDGAFDVLSTMQDLPRLVEVVRGAFWAAYLKGAGPRPEELHSLMA